MDTTVEFNLGALELRCNTSALDVQLSCLAHFTLPENGADVVSREQLVASLSALAAADRPWVSRGPNFRLVISLSTDPGLQLAERDEIGNLLASSLWQAQVFPF